MKHIIKIRGVISILLLILFIIVTFTGIGLYLAPSGWLAKYSSWSFLGMSKLQLERMHTIFGFIMSGLIILHLIINYKLFLMELKSLKSLTYI